MRIWPGTRRAVATAVVGLVLLVGAVVVFEERLIYFPSRTLEMDPGALGLAYEDLVFEAADGVRLHGWFVPYEKARFTVLLCHGNAGNISHRLDRVLALRRFVATSVLLFDYRGYGRSEGRPSEAGTFLDAEAALAVLAGRLGVPGERTVLFGESLGAAVAIELARRAPVRGLVLEAAFTSIADVGRSVYPFLAPLPLERLLRNRYENLAKIGALAVPILVLHGERDELVPLEHGRRLAAAARPGLARFVPVPGAGHNDAFLVGGEAYWEAWRAFLDDL